MRVIAFMLSACAAMAGAGCASSPSEKVAAAPSKPTDSVCSQERPLGSNIPVTKCRTVEQIAREREAAAEAVRNATLNGKPSSYQGNGN